MLEGRKFASTNLVDNSPERVLGSRIGFNYGDVVATADVLEHLFGTGLTAHNGDDMAFGAQSTDNDCHANVACGTKDKNGFSHGEV